MTFKVLQLVNAFRKRVTRKHRDQAASKKVSPAQDFCQDFELQAFDEIDRYLGRRTRHPKTAKHTSKTYRSVATKDKAAGKCIEWYVLHRYVFDC